MLGEPVVGHQSKGKEPLLTVLFTSGSCHLCILIGQPLDFLDSLSLS
jgi:hypothetical protein